MTKRKRNILHLIETSEPGGAETVLANIAKHLDPDTFDSLVCVLEDGWLTEHLKKLGIPYVVIENKWSYDPLFLIRLTRLIRRHRIDIVHSHEFMMTVYGAVGAKLTRVPMIGTMHGKVYYPERARRVRMLKFALSLSSKMVAVSEDLRKYLAGLFGSDSAKLITLYNGIDLSKYSSIESKQQSRELLSISENAPVAGTVGSLFKVKGLNYLLDAVPMIRNAHPDFVLLIAGEGEQESELKSQAESLGLGESVRFLGFRDDIPRVLNAMDVYVCSSLSEGHSLSILEAMALAVPIVATEVGGNPELIDDGLNGILVKKEDPSALADGICSLLNDPDLGKKFGDESRSIVEERFSLESMIREYSNLYKGLLS